MSYRTKLSFALTYCMTLPGQGVGVYGATCLRACYAISGTDLLCIAICLRNCYAMSGTDLLSIVICLRACYAMSGTDLAYGVTVLLFPNLTRTFEESYQVSAYAPALRCPILA
eukprot:113604-Rhodomonas_salina.1